MLFRSCGFFGLFPGALPVWSGEGKNYPPGETKRPKKIFSKLRVFWARQHRRALATVTVPSRLVEKFSRVRFALRWLLLLRFLSRFLRVLLVAFAFTLLIAFAWSLGLVPWPLLHGLLDVVLEALLQIAADQFFDRFLGLAAYHLRHG